MKKFEIKKQQKVLDGEIYTIILQLKELSYSLPVRLSGVFQNNISQKKYPDAYHHYVVGDLQSRYQRTKKISRHSRKVYPTALYKCEQCVVQTLLQSSMINGHQQKSTIEKTKLLCFKKILMRSLLSNSAKFWLWYVMFEYKVFRFLYLYICIIFMHQFSD